MRDIERENRILLQKILKQGSNCGTPQKNNSSTSLVIIYMNCSFYYCYNSVLFHLLESSFISIKNSECNNKQEESTETNIS